MIRQILFCRENYSITAGFLPETTTPNKTAKQVTPLSITLRYNKRMRLSQHRALILLLFCVLIGAPLTLWIYPMDEVQTSALPHSLITSSSTHSPTPTFTLTAFFPITATPTLYHSPTPTPTSTPRPTLTLILTPTIPTQAEVIGMVGFPQTLPLSCEARAAVDWARYFHVIIQEMDLFNRVPRSEDPELGFVGSPYGDWGEIPPAPYGVHAAPMAKVLRGYGLNAIADHKLTFAQLQTEIAAGRPVIVWIVGHVEPGTAVTLTINGQKRTVARYEHTILLTGYDTDHVTFLDDGQVYRRSIATFLKSWQALDNMAVRLQTP